MYGMRIIDGIISNLLKVIKIMSNKTATNSRAGVNDALNNFTGLIRTVADNL